MKERAVAWVTLTLVLALPCACADVTEAVSASTNDVGASSSGGATGSDGGPITAGDVDTTDGSASAAMRRPTPPSRTRRRGPALARAATPRAQRRRPPTARRRTAPRRCQRVDPCDPDVADTACDTCVKSACCPQIQTCFQDAGCTCVMPCLGDGYGLLACFGACGLFEAPPGASELAMCAGDSCSAALWCVGARAWRARVGM